MIPPVGEEPENETQECYEHGIIEIEYAASSTYNRSHTPRGRVVKWFEDDMGNLWVKWNHQTQDRHYVVPADRVVVIVYEGLSHSLLNYNPE